MATIHSDGGIAELDHRVKLAKQKILDNRIRHRQAVNDDDFDFRFACICCRRCHNLYVLAIYVDVPTIVCQQLLSGGRKRGRANARSEPRGQASA